MVMLVTKHKTRNFISLHMSGITNTKISNAEVQKQRYVWPLLNTYAWQTHESSKLACVLNNFLILIADFGPWRLLQRQKHLNINPVSLCTVQRYVHFERKCRNSGTANRVVFKRPLHWLIIAQVCGNCNPRLQRHYQLFYCGDVMVRVCQLELSSFKNHNDAPGIRC